MCGLPLTLTHSSPLTLAHFPTHSHTIAHCVCVGVCVCCVQYIVFDICPLTFDSVLRHCPLAFDSVLTHYHTCRVCCVLFFSLCVCVTVCVFVVRLSPHTHTLTFTIIIVPLACHSHTPSHRLPRVFYVCFSLSGCVCHCLCTRWSPPPSHIHTLHPPSIILPLRFYLRGYLASRALSLEATYLTPPLHHRTPLCV